MPWEWVIEQGWCGLNQCESNHDRGDLQKIGKMKANMIEETFRRLEKGVFPEWSLPCLSILDCNIMKNGWLHTRFTCEGKYIYATPREALTTRLEVASMTDKELQSQICVMVEDDMTCPSHTYQNECQTRIPRVPCLVNIDVRDILENKDIHVVAIARVC